MSRCNLCALEALKEKYGKRLHITHDTASGWTSVYLKNETPHQGQITAQLPDGTPLRFLASYMSVSAHDHSTSMADDMFDSMLSGEW